jgi:hypothetical protein
MAKNNINFIDPNSQNALANALALQQAQRQQEYAQAQLKQGLEPLGRTEMLGNVAIRKSPLEALAKVLQVYYGRKGIDEADKNLVQQQLNQQSDLAKYFGGGQDSNLISQAQNQNNTNQTITSPVPDNEAVQESTPAINTQPIIDAFQNRNSQINPPANPFSWQGSSSTQANSSQPISIADSSGNVSKISPWQPVNNIQPLPNNVQTQGNIPQNANQSMPMQNAPQNNAPFNPFGLNPQLAQYLYNQDPSAYTNKLLDAYSPTNLQKENQYLGINQDLAKQLHLQGQNKDINAATLSNGVLPQLDANGRVVGVNPLQGYNQAKAQQTLAQNQANMPYEAYKAGLEINKQNLINRSKQDLENQNTLVDTINPNTGNKQAITRQQALQGGAITGLGEANNQLSKDYASDYTTSLKNAESARQILPSAINTAKLILKTPTGQGTIKRNEVANTLAAIGIKLPNKNLSNQQLLQSYQVGSLFNEIQRQGGAKGLAKEESALLERAIGNLDTDPNALLSLTFDIINKQHQNIASSQRKQANVNDNSGFTKYSQVYNANPIDKNISLYSAIKGDRDLTAAFFSRLNAQERNKLIQTLKGQ